MSAHVVVIDSAARRHNIKTTPSKHLSDVLEEACSKAGVNASHYGLKLSGLASGAKLELVQLSRSTGVVSVALQLPESEAQGTSARLTDKFPSSTTLWLLLRKFEAGVAGTAMGTRNLTAKGAPATSSGNSGAGRLYYQQPVIQIMGRELTSFTDLQKSLAQLGFNTGSALLRLSYRTSDIPLEDAMIQIQQYFDTVDASAPALPAVSQPPSTAQQLGQATDDLPPSSSMASQPAESETLTELIPSTTSAQVLEPTQAQADLNVQPHRASVGDRFVSVFRPPTSSAPSAALAHYNEADFVPTVEHAQIHQKMLQQSSLNKRLMTDAELEQQAREEAEKLSAIKDVEIKIRFPDQSTVSAKFNHSDSAAELYSFARGCLDESLRDEPFLLRNPGMRGKGETIPDDNKKLLIRHLLLKGRVLVVFGWTDETSMEARGARNVLKSSLRSLAQDVHAPSIPDAPAEQDPGITVNIGKKEESSGGEVSSGKKLPKWLKGLTKK